jgi:DNA-binding transcriptional ArsR family regulator
VRTSASPALDATFAALADPTRRAIVARLAMGEATVLELAAPFDMSLPAISKHLKVLERAGLITRGRDAQRRPCRLRVEALEDVTAWAEQTRRVWEERFDRLGAYLRQVQAAGGADARDARDARDLRDPNDSKPPDGKSRDRNEENEENGRKKR